MAMNRIQFQPGLSLPAFHAQFGTEEQCVAHWKRYVGRKASVAQSATTRITTYSRVGSIRPSNANVAGCQHRTIIAGVRKPKDLPEFNWINTVLGNLKTSLGGAYHAFDFAKYGTRYLGAFVYRFNRRFHLEALPLRLLVAATTIGPRPACWLRQAEESF